jgi:site-specific DNA recombinase
MHKLAALYARVSTQQQEQEATIDSQVAAIENYAQAQGYQLSKELYFLDQAVSGAQFDRPALNRLRDQASEGLFQVVLCLSPDRLSRQYAHQYVLLTELKRAGVEVVFVNQPPVGNDPQGQLLLGIQGLFSEYERAMITERMRRGKLYRMRQGQLHTPVAPYGYRYIPVRELDGGRWEIEPCEAQVVGWIYDWYLQPGPLTIWNIVDRLNQLGKQAPPRAKLWRWSTVETILKQADYTGQAYYNRTQICNEVIGRPRRVGRGRKQAPVRQLRPKEEWIPIQVPALSPATFQQAQGRLAMNKQFAVRNNKHNFYLLRGLLVCSVCGWTLVGRTTQHKQTYYCRNQGKQRSPDVPPHRCIVAAEVVEPLLWAELTRLLRNPKLIADAWDSQNQPQFTPSDDVSRWQGRLKSLERQWQRLLDLFQEEKIEKAELAVRKERLDTEKEIIKERLRQFQGQSQLQQAREQMLRNFASFCQQIEAGLDHPTPELQQEVIRLLIDHVVVGPDEIVIKHIIPTDDDCRLLPGRSEVHVWRLE